MHDKLQEHWYALPVFSGVLLVLAFHPFNFWLLGFIALAPLYYFVAGFAHVRARVWWGGFITGALFSFCLSYFTIIQFHWLPEAHLFTTLVHLAVVPITLIGGSVCGIAMLLFRALRGSSLLLSVALGAAVYAGSEVLLQLIFGGYYLAELAYVATAVPLVMWLAPIGGATLVSFMVAAVSVAIAEMVARHLPWKEFVPLLVVAVALCFCAFLYHRSLESTPSVGTLSVALLQQGIRTQGQFGVRTPQGFSFPWLSDTLAHTPTSTLVVYPFSPVEGALYQTEAPFNKKVLVASEKEFGAFVKKRLPQESTLLTWNTLYDGSFHNQYQLWKEGAVVSVYQKRAPFPFMDYTPKWAQRAGLFSTPFDVEAGEGNTLAVGTVPLGALLCSEVHSHSLAREDARRSPLLIAVGSEAMFQDSVASAFSLKAAQFRAAENHVTTLRGNILGPSATINPDGSLRTYAPAGKEALLHDTIPLIEPRETLFNRTGEWLTLALIFGILGATLWRRYSR